LAQASTSGYRAPTSRDIPRVTLTPVPPVDNTVFKNYLTKIGPLFESIQRRRGDKGQDVTGMKVESRDVVTNDTDKPKRPDISRQNSGANLSPVIETRRRSAAYSKRKPNEPTPLSTVPSVYFEEEFHLENPRTFDVVSERSEIIRPASNNTESEKQPIVPRKTLATNAILQEKISWYMDTVEIHLINSISAASSSFFVALGSLQSLQKEAEDSALQIQQLRADLANLDRGLVQGGLAMTKLRNRRRNIGKLFRATEQVGRVIDQVSKCEKLLNEGEFEAVADNMDKVDLLIRGEDREDMQADETLQDVQNGSNYFDLRDLKVMKSVSMGLQDLKTRLGKSYETRFITTILKDIRAHIDSVPCQDTIKRWANTSHKNRMGGKPFKVAPLWLETSPEFREQLLSSLQGFEKCALTSTAATALQSAIKKEIKALIRRHLPSSTDDDTESVTSTATRGQGGRGSSQQEKSAVLARNLRSLDERDAETLFVGICTNVSEALRRLGVQIKILLDLTSGNALQSTSRVSMSEASGNPALTRNGSINQTSETKRSSVVAPNFDTDMSSVMDLSSLVNDAVEVAHTQIVRVLKVRAEQTHNLSLKHFVRYYTLFRYFADECEAVSGNSGQTLKGILNTQAIAYVSNMAEVESQKLCQQLDGEQWEAKDFQDSAQIILSRILEGMNSDASIWTCGVCIWDDPSSFPNEQEKEVINSDNNIPEANGKSSAKLPAKPAYIDETRFILIPTTAHLLTSIDTFLSLTASLPTIAPSTTVPALSEVLRNFNIRTSQLILGAGATRIAGLKNITTKHLALSSQSLSFITALIPYMREAVRRHVSGQQGRVEALAEFENVKRVLWEHQIAIQGKLLDIMSARARAHMVVMKKINYDEQGKSAQSIDNSDGGSAFMETLTKETGTLYRVLNKHISEGDVLGIMTSIARSYGEICGQNLKEVVVETELGKARCVSIKMFLHYLSTNRLL